jgi:hypothetical protein
MITADPADPSVPSGVGGAGARGRAPARKEREGSHLVADADAAARSVPAVVVRAADHGSPSDRAVVLRILREYFATKGDDADARYRWLYLSNPHGIARTYVACDDSTGAAVGVTSLFPRRVHVGEHEVMGAIGGDAFVTPSHRRRGIVTALHRLALADLGERLAFMFGPPEPNNLRALLQAGATLTGSVRRYTRPLRIDGLGTRGARFGAVLRPLATIFSAPESRLSVEPMRTPFDPRVDVVWRSLLECGESARRVLPVRDASYYAWRFGSDAPGRQRGFVVLDGAAPIAVAALERARSRAAIVDVTCRPLALRGVVRALLQACGDADAVDIQIHVPSPMMETALASLGFVPRGTKPFQVQSKPSFEHHGLVTTPRAWHYTWGDGDVDHVL